MNRTQIKKLFTNEETGLVNPEDYRNGNGKLDMNPFVCKRDGVYEIRDSFFYRHGKTAQDWAQKVQAFAQVNNVKITIVESGEVWKAWPSTSYWFVRFTVA